MAGQERKVAIVTGAGSGIGLATARLLSREGFAVVLAGRRRELLETAAAELVRAGGAAVALECDVADAAAARSLIGQAFDRFGRVDALVDNAGVAPFAPIDKHTPEIIEECFAANALGPANTIAAAWPIMSRERSGVIVNVSSKASADPFPGFFAYAASKAALNLMARSCAIEGAALGIRAFAIAPGAVETAMLRGLFDERAIPRGACLRPESVAAFIVECVVHSGNYENGGTFFV